MQEFTAVLFIIANPWKQPQDPSVDEQSVSYPYITYYLARHSDFGSVRSVLSIIFTIAFKFEES
jgi:hypothetical protein